MEQKSKRHILGIFSGVKNLMGSNKQDDRNSYNC